MKNNNPSDKKKKNTKHELTKELIQVGHHKDITLVCPSCQSRDSDLGIYVAFKLPETNANLVYRYDLLRKESIVFIRFSKESGTFPKSGIPALRYRKLLH